MVNPDNQHAASSHGANEDAAARQAAELAIELTEASDLAKDDAARTAADAALVDEDAPSADADGNRPRGRRKITGALSTAGSGVARRSSDVARRTTEAAGRGRQAAGLRTQAAAQAAGRGSRRAGRGSLTALTWLTSQVIAMGPRLRIRDQATLRGQFPRRDDQEIGRPLLDPAARAGAAVCGCTAAPSAVPVLPAFPAEIATETLAVVGIEIKLVAELHEILGVPAHVNAT